MFIKMNVWQLKFMKTLVVVYRYMYMRFTLVCYILSSSSVQWNRFSGVLTAVVSLLLSDI